MTPRMPHHGDASSRAAARKGNAQRMLEVVVFVLAACVVIASARNAKRAELGPPAVALERGPESKPVKLVAGTFDNSRAASHVGPSSAIAAATEQGPPDRLASARTPARPEPAIAPPPGFKRYFDGRPLRVKKIVWMTVTAYSPDARSCGDSADGITSTNNSVWTNGMNLVAADPKILPYGSLLTVPGYANGEVVPVLDCGGAIKGARLDVLYPLHEIARKWGVQRLPVTVWEYAD